MSMTRRQFLATAAGTAAALSATGVTAATRARSVGANDRIRIGVIGCGGRGVGAHMTGVEPYIKDQNYEIIAIADPWRVSREKGIAKVKQMFGREPKAFVSYRDVLEMKDIDAVMIASPDHHHTTHLEAAARAKKHIYMEKPIAQDMEALNRAFDAVKKAGVVVQIGTQIRSLPEIVACRELCQSGLFGKISRVEECRNAERPYWYGYLKDVKEEDVDWQEFLGGIKPKPFRADYYSGWYGYYDTSRGPTANLGCHFYDLVHYITGAQYPESCVCVGGTYTWKDEHEFTAPDCAQATFIYPEGFMVSSANNLGNGHGNVRRLYGDQGVLDFTNWSAPFYHAQGAPNRAKGKIRGEKKVEPIEHPDHFLDWLQCLRTGKECHAPIEAGHQHAVTAIMAITSYETGRKTVYDREKRQIRTV